MTDLRTALRTYFDAAATPVGIEEIVDRRRRTPTQPPISLRPLVLATAVTLVAIGGWLVGLRFFDSNDRSGAPGAVADDYRYSGVEWMGFEFAYPGDGTTLEDVDGITLVEGPRPYPEYTLLQLSGVDDRGYVSVLWVSYQSGHGSIVRDALVVGHPQIRPNLQIGCTAQRTDGVSGHPAAVLRTPDGTSVLRAWYVDVSVLTIEAVDPSLVGCPPRWKEHAWSTDGG